MQLSALPSPQEGQCFYRDQCLGCNTLVLCTAGNVLLSLLLVQVDVVLLQGLPMLWAAVPVIKEQMHLQMVHPKNLMKQTLQLPKLHLPLRFNLLTVFMTFLMLAVQ